MSGFNYMYDVIKDFSEFSHLSFQTIEKRINGFEVFTSKEWNDIPHPSYEEKVNHFYKTSQYYIYDLLSANYSKKAVIDKLNNFSPQILQMIDDHPGKRIMEYGGGLGVFCEIVADMGKEVTYLDIPGLIFDFATWRFKKYHIPISRTMCSDPNQMKLDMNYDIIFSDAVLEHVLNPEKTIQYLCTHIATNGLFILLVDLSGPTKNYPMHQHINIDNLHKIIRENHFQNIIGDNKFCSIWQKIK